MDVNTYKSNVIGQTGQQTTTGKDAYQEMDMDHFLKLMVTELSNQDPMNPMDNTEILQQLSQMREIASNDKLTATLEAVQLGQNMATAGSLLGQVIRGLDDEGGRVIGAVERVSLSEEDGIRIHVGDQAVKLTNIAEVYPEGTDPDSVEWVEVDTGSDTDPNADLYW